MAFGLPVVDVASLVAWCEAHLGSPAESELFRTGHLACVIGARLADGREVVVSSGRPRRGSPRAPRCSSACSMPDIPARSRWLAPRCSVSMRPPPRAFSHGELQRCWAAGVWTGAFDAKQEHAAGQPVTRLTQDEARERLRRAGVG